MLFNAVSKFVGAPLTILIIVGASLLAGCAGRPHVPIELLNGPPCDNASGILWAGPKAMNHRAQLSDWCRSVGPVVIQAAAASPVDVATSGLTVVTWNQHEDYGNLEQLLHLYVGKSPVIALIQEVARASDSVPLVAPSTVRVPRRINPHEQMEKDIQAIAAKFHLSLANLPSMPNGIRTREDRGCAILSTLPISDVMGIELPWVAQRRVAVMATVTALRNSVPWRLRVVSAHLDNRSGRLRQAAAMADFLKSLEDLPMVIGADLNTLYGIKDRAVSEVDRIAPLVRKCGNRSTFPLRFWFDLRLDHFFMTLPQKTVADCFVAPDRFGSDHHPIVLSLVFDAL